jgi:DNA-binding NarL/FixJ family response regulator
MTEIKVLLADDHALFREGMRSLLEDQADIIVVGEAADGIQAEKLAAKLQPDVILMDINMPLLDGVEATRLILRAQPTVGIIILTMHRQDKYVLEAMKSGARAYLLKDTRSKKLLEVIRVVSQGQVVMDPDIAQRLLFDANHSSGSDKTAAKSFNQSLTDQEHRLLGYLVSGLSNREIAEAMNLSERTIKNYLSILFHKLRVNNRTEAAMKAMKAGYLEVDDL